MSSNISSLEAKIGYKFNDISLLVTALTHKSYANENSNMNLKNNERLEFLGDAVLDLITTEYLYYRYPNYDEGVLTKIQSHIISSKALSEVAKKLDFGEYIRLSKGELMLGGKDKSSILGDTFETVMGAIFIDSNFETVKKIVLSLLKEMLDSYDSLDGLRDYKTELQEKVQSKYTTLPIYKIEKTFGPDHHKLFQVSVYVKNEKMGIGFAGNKKEAEKIAAKQAYYKMTKEEK